MKIETNYTQSFKKMAQLLHKTNKLGINTWFLENDFLLKIEIFFTEYLFY